MAPGETMVSEGPILADVAPGPPGTVLNAPAPTNAIREMRHRLKIAELRDSDLELDGFIALLLTLRVV